MDIAIPAYTFYALGSGLHSVTHTTSRIISG